MTSLDDAQAVAHEAVAATLARITSSPVRAHNIAAATIAQFVRDLTEPGTVQRPPAGLPTQVPAGLAGELEAVRRTLTCLQVAVAGDPHPNLTLAYLYAAVAVLRTLGGFFAACVAATTE